MNSPAYIVSIDPGTTNCSVSYTKGLKKISPLETSSKYLEHIKKRGDNMDLVLAPSVRANLKKEGSNIYS
jgi:hypothetical protein